MSTLTIHQGHQVTHVSFDAPASLSSLLAKAGMSVGQPCGGRGMCGKCAVVLGGDVSSPNGAEKRFGVRLACQAVIQGDADVTLPVVLPMEQIAGGSTANRTPLHPMDGRLGAAVDIGTTTLALLLFDLTSGACIGSASMLNPQTVIAADVIGRIDAALKGHGAELRQQAEDAISALLSSACTQAHADCSVVDSMVITGNTTMLYLLTGRNPSSLARAPFQADCFFGIESGVLSRKVYLPECLHAFVGADTTCALLACGMTDMSESALLCDVGTNGELALWHEGRLFIASTAAGPAFEGAGIICGCSSIPGAIDQVSVVDGAMQCHTIGSGSAAGICGSGLVDAIAALLKLGILDETGYLEDDEVLLRDEVKLLQADIRAVQLAKAATCAGIMSLLSAAGCSAEQVSRVYLAGGFGSHLNIQNAARIGLIPADLAEKVQVIGNAALDGAAMLLMDTFAREKVAALSALTQHVRLDGNPDFVQRYVDAMLFYEE